MQLYLNNAQAKALAKLIHNNYGQFVDLLTKEKLQHLKNKPGVSSLSDWQLMEETEADTEKDVEAIVKRLPVVEQE